MFVNVNICQWLFLSISHRLWLSVCFSSSCPSLPFCLFLIFSICLCLSLSITAVLCHSFSFFPFLPLSAYFHLSLTVSLNCLCILLCIAIYFDVCLSLYNSIHFCHALLSFLSVCVPPCHSLCFCSFNNIYTQLLFFCTSLLVFVSQYVWVHSFSPFSYLCDALKTYVCLTMSLNFLSLCLCLSFSLSIGIFISVVLPLFLYI